MKILHIITDLQMGGAEKLMTLLLPQIQSEGHDVELLVFNGIRTPLYEDLSKKRVKIHYLGMRPNVYHPSYLYRLVKFLGTHTYDVVHTHNTAPQLYAAIAHVQNKKFKMFTTEHSTNNRRRSIKWLVPMDRWMYHQYDGVVCISDQAEINLIKHLGETAANVLTIYNGVNVSLIANADADIKLKKGSDKFIITMVARMVEAKDQDTLIRAMSHLSPVSYELWLVGDGVRHLALEDLVKKLHIERQVHFWGVRMDVPTILKTSDVIVMSSHWEGLSLSNIEGMAAGKPFVASNVDGIREVTEGAGILFTHEDDKALAEILQKLKQNPEFYQETAHRCLERARKYDISIMAQKYVSLYQKFLHK